MQAALDQAEQALASGYWHMTKQDVRHWPPETVQLQLAIRRNWLKASSKRSDQPLPKHVTIPKLGIDVTTSRIQKQVAELESMIRTNSQRDGNGDVSRLQVRVDMTAQPPCVTIRTTDAILQIAQLKEWTVSQMMEQLEIRFNWFSGIKACHHSVKINHFRLRVVICGPGLETNMSMAELRKDINDILTILRLRSMYDKSSIITKGRELQLKPPETRPGSYGSAQTNALRDYCQYLTDLNNQSRFTGPWFNCLYQAWRLCDYLRTELVEESYQLPVLPLPTQSRQSIRAPPSGSHLPNQACITPSGINTFQRGAQSFQAYPGVFSDVWLI